MPYGWVWELKIVPRKVHRCETTNPKRFDRDETRREAINYFKTDRIDHRQRLLSASEDPWDLQGTRRSSENEVKRGSPLASSLASKIVPAPQREHDFHLGYLAPFCQKLPWSSRWLSWLPSGCSWGLSWLHFGCSWLLFGVSWGSLGFLLGALEALFATD